MLGENLRLGEPDASFFSLSSHKEVCVWRGERSRLGCTGRRPADRTVCSARAPNTAREARALPTLNTYPAFACRRQVLPPGMAFLNAEGICLAVLGRDA